MVWTDEGKTRVLSTKEHYHASNLISNEVTKVVQGIKQRAKTTIEKPIQIYAAGIQNASDDVRSNFPTEEVLKRTLRNQRAADFSRMPNSLKKK